MLLNTACCGVWWSHQLRKLSCVSSCVLAAQSMESSQSAAESVTSCGHVASHTVTKHTWVTLYFLCVTVSLYLFLCPFLCMASSSAIYGSAPTYPSRMVCVTDLPRYCSLHSARSSRLLVAPTWPSLLMDKILVLSLKSSSWSWRKSLGLNCGLGKKDLTFSRPW